MGKSSRPPPPPDPRAVAGAQTQQNRESALYNAGLNRINTNTPYGSQTYSTNGIDPVTGAPRYEQNITLDPQLEGLYRQQMGTDQQFDQAAGGALSQVQGMQPFSLSGLPQRSDLDSIRGGAQDALYSRNTAFLDPQFKQGEDALRSRLANQGIVEGSEAYTNAMGDFNRSKEFSYGQARDASIAGGGAEADRAFGMDEQLRNNMISEQLLGRSVPFQELAQLRSMGGGQVQLPQFEGTSQVGTNPADIAGAMYNQHQGQMDAYNARMQQRNALLGGAAQVGSAFLLSDERAKEDIQPIGELNDGTGLFLFKYKGDDSPQVGVMAQDVEKRDPGAVRMRPDGFKEVNYQRVLSAALEAA